MRLLAKTQRIVGIGGLGIDELRVQVGHVLWHLYSVLVEKVVRN